MEHVPHQDDGHPGVGHLQRQADRRRPGPRQHLRPHPAGAAEGRNRAANAWLGDALPEHLYQGDRRRRSRRGGERQMTITRRDFNRFVLAGVPAAFAASSWPLAAAAPIDSKIKGVQIGAITYSFRTMPGPREIIKAYQAIGLGEMELMSRG